ncbi:RNA polymerase sigma factor [Salmonirosea aquatica]|uniref:Sigma-70 family RNA polymerase sigma factor n=1 Tax=Salmonirosea aquatica TaxID=2654236 RepID=A0A7C9BEY4_9BACT|nr:sigma-70 family RNA polymerase sigma factor [Cytophagaceae bacterium SJW1-29]
MGPKTDDRDVWTAFKAGDESALELLYTRYFKALGTYGFRITHDRERVEDAIQDVFVDLWRRRENLGDVENIRFYLFRSLRNQLSRNIRHDVFDGAEDIDDFLDYLATLSSEQQSIDQEVQLSRAQAVQKALSQLSQRQREAVHLRFYQGLSLDESAEIMGIGKQVVKNLLSKSYAILRLSLKVAFTLWAWCFSLMGTFR